MALPLLMGVGAGILGGVSYLTGEANKRKAQTQVSNLESTMANSPWANTQGGMSLLAKAQNDLESASFMDWATGDPNQMLDRAGNFLTANIWQQEQMEQQRQAVQQRAMIQSGVTQTTALEGQYRRDMEDFAVLSDSFNKAILALDSNNSADAVAGVYNFFNIIEPGGIVRDGETGEYRGVGGSGSRVANWLNSITGEGLSASSVSDIRDALMRQYTPRYERANRQKVYVQDKVDRLRGQNPYVNSPIGMLGLDWNFLPGGEGNQLQPDVPPTPAGFSDTPPTDLRF